MSQPSAPQCGIDVVSEITRLFERNGHSQYGGEAVSQLQHALQAALLAEKEGAESELIVAALLHDIGHLIHHLPSDAPDQGIDDLHEKLAADWLRERFPPAVLEPIRLHVTAKRYLCATEEGYWESLSEPSKHSLELQGGTMPQSECEDFQSNPHYEAAVRVRKWDDLAKVEDLETPNVEHYMKHVVTAALT